MRDNIDQRTVCFFNEMPTPSISTQVESISQYEYRNGHFYETIENDTGSPWHYFY